MIKILFDPRRLAGRLSYWALAILLAGSVSRASGPLTTTVNDIVYRADGGNSQLARWANNFFGIKAHANQPSLELPTWECRDGKSQLVSARFARFVSMEACFLERDCLISTLSLYAQARLCALASPKNVAGFVAGLPKHWATDPEYSSKLLRIYHDNAFNQLD